VITVSAIMNLVFQDIIIRAKDLTFLAVAVIAENSSLINARSVQERLEYGKKNGKE
jgi:hypothetical protein